MPPEATDDEDLVRAAQGGDRAALDLLLRQHYDRVYGVCRRIAGNEADALDAAQEALLAVVRHLGSFDGTARFSTWLYRVATNACLDELRRRRRRPEPGLPDDPAPAPGPPMDEIVVARADIDAALSRLPTDFRAAVVLRDLCGLDYAEIADVLGVAPGTVRSRIARGRRALAGLLARNPGAAPDRPTPRP